MVSLRELPFLGVGIGFRPELQKEQSRHLDRIDWFELIADRYLRSVPESIERARAMKGRQALVPHGLELSVGTEGPLDLQYCDEVAELVRTLRAPFYSDHLCMTKAGGFEIGQLTPLPFTEAAARRAARKARDIQRLLGVPFLLENVSYSFAFPSPMTEQAFVSRVVTEADCGLLLDLTNVFINSQNHRYDPYAFLEALPLDRVIQIHLAGGEKHGGRWVDSHSQSVDAHPEVWRLLEYVVARSPVRAVLIERDQNFPSEFQEMLQDIEHAREILGRRGAVEAPAPAALPPELDASPALLPVDEPRFQAALARLIVDPGLRQRFLEAPAATCASLELSAPATEALLQAGPAHIDLFGREVSAKRFALLAKIAPATLKLLQKERLLHGLTTRFVTTYLPRESREFPNRSVRDGFWLLDLVERMFADGEFQLAHLRDIARFERAQLSLYSTQPPVESALAARAARDARPEPTDAELLTARPRLGAHTQVERFGCDVIEAIRRVTSGASLEDVATTPTLILFLKAPGWRNVQPMGINERTATVLALCDGQCTTAELLARLASRGSTEDKDRTEAGGLKLIRDLYRLGALMLDFGMEQ
ncbi:DUF692 domain-containing protein [Myxococcus sp. K38C18041901]|uniref:DUF692 domain-containing protein n=1 Tax=Myxococcus guangdongensis TaxID=2906760 RepID=UPI0020A7CDFF|nr:DUF692 family multinuclear iron-containing protein [Myxococcus guangdongensis]MCP3065172.1 DUF692 domain-containing protein [Myxococcus guangdongensis]